MTEPACAPTVSTAPVRSINEGDTATLLLASVATFLVLMDYTAPMTTLSETADALHAGPAGQTWVLNGMPVGLAAALLVTGVLADEHGRKRLFVLGTVILALALAAGAAAPTAPVFVGARIVQGGASAAILASSLALVAEAFRTGPARARATAVWGSMIGAGIAVGPLLSSVLASWHWSTTYWVFAAASSIVGVVAARTLVESRSELPRRPDVIGAASLSLGIVALLTALSEGHDGWYRPTTLLLLLSSAVLLTLFVASQGRARHPLLDLRLFRERLFVASTAGALLTGMSVIGLMSYLPTAIQRGVGLTSIATAGMFVIWSGTSAVATYQARHLASRMTSTRQLSLGFAVCAVGLLALVGSIEAGSWVRFVPGLVIAGLGSGLGNAVLPRLAVDSVPAARAAMGSGANNTARYLGSSLGVAVVVMVVSAFAGSPAGGPAGGDAVAHGTDVSLVITAGLALLGAAVTLGLRER
ncbi:MAG: MFS transporter [Nocardioidaceae bacterium]